MHQSDSMNLFCGPAIYQITVGGKIDKGFLNYWGNMNLSYCDSKNKSFSVLTGEVKDQTALSGILNILADNRFSLISVIKLDN